MKLNELLNESPKVKYLDIENPTIDDFAQFACEIPQNSYDIIDNKIHVTGDVYIDFRTWSHGGDKLAFPFGDIDGSFTITGRHLKSLENCPEKVSGIFCATDTGITSLKGGPLRVGIDYDVTYNAELVSLEGMPADVPALVDLRGCKKLSSFKGIAKSMDRLNFEYTAITSLVGVSDHIKHVNSYIRTLWEEIKEGGLGLIQIQGLPVISRGGNVRTPSVPAFDIISSYMGRPNDIFECQAALIDAGFEEHAIL